MFAAHLQRTSLATLSGLSSARVGSVAAARAFLSTSTLRQESNPNIPSGFAKIKEKQKIFNIDNGLRVHERGGTKDKLLYNFTLLVLLVGFVEWCRVWWTMAYPGGFK
eukprot:GFUD01014811.1.p2 GENE.GFUD01014811.1~~GFUD01014811.1.p2  ORF type:complete len:108 (-),score=23.06 GFUD01014811.1:367-690(-)